MRRMFGYGRFLPFHAAPQRAWSLVDRKENLVTLADVAARSEQTLELALPAVDHQIRAEHERGIIGDQEERSTGEFFGSSNPLHGYC